MDRTCVKCGVVFSGGNRALHCGNCKPQASLDWRKQHYEKERETILDNARKYRDENREILYAKAREKYRLNKDDSDYLAKVKEKRLRHYEKNKEEIKLKNSKIRREAQDNTLSNADNNGAFWSDEEIRFLWKYAETKTAEDIALALKRTLLSVQGKAGAEGIRFGEENRHGCYGIVSERVDAEGRSGRPEPLEIVGDVDEFGNIIAKKHVDENLNKMILNQAYYVLKSYFEGKKKEDRIVDTLDLKAIYSWLWNNNMVDYIENLNNENKDKIITITDKGKEFLVSYAEFYDSNLTGFDESSSAISASEQFLEFDDEERQYNHRRKIVKTNKKKIVQITRRHIFRKNVSG